MQVSLSKPYLEDGNRTIYVGLERVGFVGRGDGLLPLGVALHHRIMDGTLWFYSRTPEYSIRLSPICGENLQNILSFNDRFEIA